MRNTELAPVRAKADIVSGSENPVVITIRQLALIFRSRRIVSAPSMIGMLRSINTRSISRPCSAGTGSAPLAHQLLAAPRTEFLEHRRDRLEQLRFVLNDKDESTRRPCRRVRSVDDCDQFGHRLRSDRQQQTEGRADTDLALDFDRPTVVEDGSVDRSKTETGSSAVTPGGEERLKIRARCSGLMPTPVSMNRISR